MITVYIYDGVNETLVNPANKNFPISYRWDENGFFASKFLDIGVNFIGDDYQFLWDTFSTDKCGKITLRIYDDCSGAKTLSFQGYCSWYDFIIDEDKCQIEAKFAPDNYYNCIKENGDKEFNILETSPGYQVTVDVFQQEYEEIWTNGCNDDEGVFCDVSTMAKRIVAIMDKNLSSFSGLGISRGNTNECAPYGCAKDCLIGFQLDADTGEPTIRGLKAFCRGDECRGVWNSGITIAETLWKHYKTEYQFYKFLLSDPGPGRFAYIKSWYRREVYFTKDVGSSIVYPPGDGWVDMGYICTGDKAADIMTEFGVDAGSLPSEFTWTSQGAFKTQAGYRKWTRLYLYDYLDSYSFTRQGCGINKDSVIFTAVPSFPPPETEVYTNGRHIRTIINYLALQICGKEAAGKIFYENINPVTGENPNPLHQLIIFQKSDIKFNSLNPDKATKAITTWNEFTGFLRDMFQIYYYVDASYIWFEHISFFYGWIPGYGVTRTVALDLTTYELGRFDRKKYSYNRPDMPNFEKFSWMEAGNEDFLGVPIEYNQLCSGARATGNEKEYNVSKVTTDIWYIQNNPNSISDEGFVFLLGNSVRYGQAYFEKGILTGQYIANAYLSWANLHNRWWKYNRPLAEGYMNNILTNFITNKGIIVGETLELFLCCEDIEIQDMVKTSIGDGDIAEMTIDLLTKQLTLNLTYGRTI
jgi:hypothetical protein